MKETLTKASSSTGGKKSKAQSSLEETLQGSTRRFSAFAELGIPSVDPQVEGIELGDTQLEDIHDSSSTKLPSTTVPQELLAS